MKPFHISFRLYLIIFVCLIIGVVVAACGSSTSAAGTQGTSHTTGSANAKSSSANGPGVTATAAETSLLQQMTFVGTPTAKIVAGTTFAVSGQLKNGDDKQHDIYVQASLLDASGKVIATTTPFNVDNVHGGTTVTFTIQGTTPQPTWHSVQVKVVKVSENINGSGDD